MKEIEWKDSRTMNGSMTWCYLVCMAIRMVSYNKIHHLSLNLITNGLCSTSAVLMIVNENSDSNLLVACCKIEDNVYLCKDISTKCRVCFFFSNCSQIQTCRYVLYFSLMHKTYLCCIQDIIQLIFYFYNDTVWLSKSFSSSSLFYFHVI